MLLKYCPENVSILVQSGSTWEDGAGKAGEDSHEAAVVLKVEVNFFQFQILLFSALLIFKVCERVRSWIKVISKVKQVEKKAAQKCISEI